MAPTAATEPGWPSRPQYCEPWARQQEQQILSVGPKAAEYSERIQSMLGYSIHPPFMGHVDGLHPLRLLDPHYDSADAGAGKAAADYWADAELPRSVASRCTRGGARCQAKAKTGGRTTMTVAAQRAKMGR